MLIFRRSIEKENQQQTGFWYCISVREMTGKTGSGFQSVKKWETVL